MYSTVPVTFHVITNEDSVPYVTKVIDKLNETSECDFTKKILTLSDIIRRSNNEICPRLGVRSEFCEIVMGNMTPLLFPWLFQELDHAIYIDRNMVFQVRTVNSETNRNIPGYNILASFNTKLGAFGMPLFELLKCC